MSREIKFVFYAKDALTQEWVKCPERRACGGVNAFFQESQIEKPQFTGLKDKNGKEVYEGDILKYPDQAIREIRWSKVTNFSGFEYHDLKIGICGILDESSTKFGEVVGNIFENPELCKIES